MAFKRGNSLTFIYQVNSTVTINLFTEVLLPLFLCLFRVNQPSQNTAVIMYILHESKGNMNIRNTSPQHNKSIQYYW